MDKLNSDILINIFGKLCIHEQRITRNVCTNFRDLLDYMGNKQKYVICRAMKSGIYNMIGSMYDAKLLCKFNSLQCCIQKNYFDVFEYVANTYGKPHFEYHELFDLCILYAAKCNNLEFLKYLDEMNFVWYDKEGIIKCVLVGEFFDILKYICMHRIFDNCMIANICTVYAYEYENTVNILDFMENEKLCVCGYNHDILKSNIHMPSGTANFSRMDNFKFSWATNGDN